MAEALTEGRTLLAGDSVLTVLRTAAVVIVDDPPHTGPLPDGISFFQLSAETRDQAKTRHAGCGYTCFCQLQSASSSTPGGTPRSRASMTASVSSSVSERPAQMRRAASRGPVAPVR